MGVGQFKKLVWAVALFAGLLACTVPAPETAVPVSYDRAQFSGWVDADRDCQDTRAELLIETSQAAVTLAPSGCTVRAGQWRDPYSGRTYGAASQIHIDHLVPLKWAWDHGAWKWSDAKRARFAVDPRNLVVVSAAQNTSKGARGPLEWMPQNIRVHCDYLNKFTRVVDAYGLEVSEAWQAQMSRQVSRNCATG